jgi:hypothetical protein
VCVIGIVGCGGVVCVVGSVVKGGSVSSGKGVV